MSNEDNKLGEMKSLVEQWFASRNDEKAKAEFERGE